MRRIAIVGAGQAGLQLAIGLAKQGYEVTMVSDRSPGEIRAGRIMSTQCMFADSLASERELGLSFWEGECPRIPGVRFNVADPEGKLDLVVWGELDSYAQSVDQRVKMAGWLEELERVGGRVITRSADLRFVEELANQHDLVLIAAGKGDIGSLFPIDSERTVYDGPQRQLAALFVTGYEPLSPPYFSISIVPGVGEYFVGPALTLDGPCYTMCLEARPGGPMDGWRDRDLRGDPQRLLRACKQALASHFPWEAERATGIELTDGQATLAGAIPPLVRDPIGQLPSGQLVLGVGDAVVLNDPLVGQGSNNAAHSAMIVLRNILDRGDRPFDSEWMRETSERVWDYVRWPTEYTNMMLNPPEHVGELLAAGTEDQGVADALANATNDPSSLFPGIRTAEGTNELIDQLSTKRPPSHG